MKLKNTSVCLLAMLMGGGGYGEERVTHCLNVQTTATENRNEKGEGRVMGEKLVVCRPLRKKLQESLILVPQKDNELSVEESEYAPSVKNLRGCLPYCQKLRVKYVLPMLP